MRQTVVLAVGAQSTNGLERSAQWLRLTQSVGVGSVCRVLRFAEEQKPPHRQMHAVTNILELEAELEDRGGVEIGSDVPSGRWSDRW